MHAPLSQRPPRKFKSKAPSEVNTFEQQIVAGDVEGVRATLERDPSSATKPIRGTPPLLLAVSLGQEEIVALLTKQGADLLAEDNHQRTALHVAAEKSHAGIMNILLRTMHRQNPKHALMLLSRPSDNGKKPLLSASKDGDTLRVIISMLKPLAKDAKKSLQALMDNVGINECHTESGLWPMHVAAANGSFDAVNALISAGANLSPKAKSPSDKLDSGSVGMTPLMLACQEGHLETARSIIKASLTSSCSGLELKTEKGGYSALHLASMMGHTDLCELLIDSGVDPTSKDASGKMYSDYEDIQPHRTDTKKKILDPSPEISTASSPDVEDLVADTMQRTSGNSIADSAPVLDMELNLAAKGDGNSKKKLLDVKDLGSRKHNIKLTYLEQEVGNPTLAYLIPHIEKALIALTKKYESAAMREYAGEDTSSSSFSGQADVEHHPKDAFATYMLRHKLDKTLPQPWELEK